MSQGAKSAYDAYAQLVILGQLPTNDVPTISAKYDLLQAAVTVAISVSRNDTNAVAPEALTTVYNDFLTTVTTAKKATK